MKNPAIYEELLKKLVRVYEEGPDGSLGVFEIPVAAYTDQARLEAERRLLRRLPIPVAHRSQLQANGSCLVHDALGVPILIARNRDGELRAMLNVCRHRGTRLLEDGGFCKVRKGFQCRYHGWSYDLEGQLTKVPREELFPTLDKSELGLRAHMSGPSSAGVASVRPWPMTRWTTFATLPPRPTSFFQTRSSWRSRAS